MAVKLAQNIPLLDRIGSNFNAWPDLEFVKAIEFDMTDPLDVFSFAWNLGHAQAEGQGQLRQIRRRSMPDGVQRMLVTHGYRYDYSTVYVTLAGERGQSDDAATRNLYVVFTPMKGYDYETRKQTFERPGLIVEIGCRHKYITSRVGRCATAGDCTRCGHHWEIDSSD